ncbi:YlqD family protein [Bacillus sp. S/N-304-OC-R1]|uniref:YlqD family protein n=1 Tax=Bacillus sp. S/N-304-OC-R1 TaxID=2758034 RepID=UPI001C8E41C3|nr:YlqD family protein [Bacillus sp. S/N-304-OC-R1]MBY0120719.1 YlqD family protein [Bacillus sp. S/N-304-OC-R1]
MKILQSVVVKQVLTENSKSVLLKKYQNQKQQLQKECDQLRFELKRQEKTNTFQTVNLKKQFEKELQGRKEKIKLIDFQMEQLHILPLGSELKEKEVTAIIDVEVGDRWEDIQNGRTIIIRDGIVDDIR